jgi:arylsulfatase A-like enzyme
VRPRDAARCPVSILDVAPTVLEAFGLPPAPDHRGRSLLARAEPEGCAARELWAGALAYGPDSLAVREERWKLSVRGGRAPVLADLVADPAEAADATGRAPRIAARLGERLTRARAAAGPDDVTATPLDAEQARELRALGYL